MEVHTRSIRMGHPLIQALRVIRLVNEYMPGVYISFPQDVLLVVAAEMETHCYYFRERRLLLLLTRCLICPTLNMCTCS